MREPSIHITRSNLKKVLSKVLPNVGFSDKTMDNIMKETSHLSINSRNTLLSNERIEKKANSILSSSRGDTDLLSKLVYSVRKRAKHKGIVQIKPNTRDWLLLKQMTSQALDFSNEFNLNKRLGFLKYLEVGLSKMKKFSLNKYLSMYEAICETYQAMVEIRDDSEKELTNKLYKSYSSRIMDNTGIFDRLEEQPEKYVWFVRARREAKSLNISVELYINAQFSNHDFSRGILYPSQLIGPKAVDKVINYCIKNNIKIKR